MSCLRLLMSQINIIILYNIMMIVNRFIGLSAKIVVTTSAEPEQAGKKKETWVGKTNIELIIVIV